MPDVFEGLDLQAALGSDEAIQEFQGGLRTLAGQLALRSPSEWRVSDEEPEFGYGSDLSGREHWLDTDLPVHPGSDGYYEINVGFRAWVPPPFKRASRRLWRLRLFVDVPCDCWRDHGNHPVDQRRFEGGTSRGFDHAVSEALAQIDQWLERTDDDWREWAGLRQEPQEPH